MMKKVISMLLVAVLAIAMSAGVAEESALKIGFIGPLTGAAAVYGTSCLQGAQIAVEEINALGGMQIELNAQDDEHDAEKSVNAYNTLWDWGCQMIAGCVTTAPCKAVAAEAYNDRMFMLTPSASSPDVTANNDNVFQVCFNDPAMGTESAKFIVENKLAEKVAVIYNNADAYSTGIYQTFVAKAAELGLEVVSTTTFTDDTTDFSVQLTEAKDNGAELVYLPIYYTPASMILNQANAMQYAPLFCGVDGMDGILTLEGFDTSLAEGVVLLTPFSVVGNDKSVSFTAKYEAAYGETPTQFSADGYDAIYALYEMCVNSGITGETAAEDACEILIEQIKSFEFSGTTGEMVWSEDGEVSKLPLAVVIKDGAYERM